MKIASLKKAKPSIPKARPNTEPNVAMKFGHSPAERAGELLAGEQHRVHRVRSD